MKRFIYEASHDNGHHWIEVTKPLVKAVVARQQGADAVAEVMEEMEQHGLEAQMPSGAIYRARRLSERRRAA